MTIGEGIYKGNLEVNAQKNQESDVQNAKASKENDETSGSNLSK